MVAGVGEDLDHAEIEAEEIGVVVGAVEVDEAPVVGRIKTKRRSGNPSRSWEG